MSPADDETWTWSVDDRTTELADFSGQPRAWSSVVLAVAGIVTLAVLVICVVIVANDSTRPPHVVPLSVPPLPTTAAPAPTMQSSVPGSPMAPVAPPEFRPTVTASTVAVAPSVVPAPVVPVPTGPAPVVPAPTGHPPAAAARTPAPKPSVRQRLHDLFPRLFPDP